ncbi:hypothetical protein [Acidipropionibacterium jensenii]|uniref:hypothetical protein n=1 Tax=Acidipropionibacterium jensenii TaxID=1749 RepID=UPI00214A9A20|nr:hypothetical protein [Acidipropionibacterium jensenii]
MRRRYSSPPPARMPVDHEVTASTADPEPGSGTDSGIDPDRPGHDPLILVLTAGGGVIISAVALVLLGIPASTTRTARLILRSALAWFASNWNTPRILYVVVPLVAMTVLVVTSEVLSRPPRSSGTTR